MRGTIWIVVVLFVVGGVAFGVGGTEVHDAAGETRNATEQHTLSQNSSTTLDHASEWTRMFENETVTDSNGTELERGTDYEIDNGTGELWASDSTYDGETVTVDYHYRWHDETTRHGLAVVAPLMNNVFGLLTLVAGVGVLIAWIGRW